MIQTLRTIRFEGQKIQRVQALRAQADDWDCCSPALVDGAQPKRDGGQRAKSRRQMFAGEEIRCLQHTYTQPEITEKDSGDLDSAQAENPRTDRKQALLTRVAVATPASWQAWQ